MHQKTLKIYEQVFKNLSLAGPTWSVDLGLFCMGLFPFMRYCSVQVKSDLLQLVEDHLLPLGAQLAVALPALVPSVLLMFEENDESIKNKTGALMDKVVSAMGSKFVNGCIYMGLLRKPSYRTALLKYINTTKKKKLAPANNKELSVIHSQGENEDLHSQLPPDIEEERGSTIQSMLTKPMLADQLDREMRAPREDRFQSVKEDTLHATSLVKFGDDQSVNYSGEVLSLKPSNNNSLLAEPPVASRKASAKSMNEEEDQYGMNSTKGNAAFDKEELEQLQAQLLEDYQNEFKDGLTIVENLPKGKILLSAIQSCLLDDNKLVKRGILDMVNNYVKLTDNLLLDEEQKVELIETMMTLLLRRDLSVTRRMYGWFFGEPDLDNNYVIDESRRNVLTYIEKAFEKIFNTYQTDDIKTCSAPLKILQNFYMDHEKAVGLTIGRISIPLIKFIYVKGIKNRDEKVKEEVSKSGIRFLSCVTSHFHLIVEEISKAIAVASNAELKIYSGIIKFIKDCFSNPELQISELRVQVRLLEGLTSFLLKVRIVDVIESYIDNDFEHMKLTLKVLQIFVEIIEYLFAESDLWSGQELRSMILSIPGIAAALLSFEKDFIELSRVLASFKVPRAHQIEDNCVMFKDLQGRDQYLNEELPGLLVQTLRFAVLSVVVMQKVVYSNKSAEDVVYPAWMKGLVACIQSDEPNICRVAIEGLIYVISSARKEEIFVRLRNSLKDQASSAR